MAPRFAVLIALLSAPGCVQPKLAAGAEPSCRACHAAHYAQQGTCQECHRGDPATRRKELAHARLLSGRVAEHPLSRGPAVEEGRRLVAAAACRRCHSIGGAGNRLAMDLDRIAWKREQAELVAAIREPAGDMPSFGFDRDQTEALIAFLLNSRGVAAPEDSYQVRFAREGGRSSPFEEKCGGCHRALSPRTGPLGAGRAAPNLSGLFTPFYPATAPGERPWTEAALADWVSNPRALRATAMMPPVALSEEERRSIEATLGGRRAPVSATGSTR